MALTTIDDRGLKTPIDLLDNEKIRFGTGNDLEVFHNGTDSFVKNTTGQLCLNSDEFGVANAAYTENIIRGTVNSDVELYYDNVKKFYTTSEGALVSGALGITGQNLTHGTNTLKIGHEGSGVHQIRAYGPDSSTNGKIQFRSSRGDGSNSKDIVYSSGNLEFPDNQQIRLGTGEDLKIYHDGSNSYIQEAGTGQLKLDGSTIHLRNYANSNTMAIFEGDEAVELYYNNSKKFETTSGGATVTGNLSATSNLLLADSVKARFGTGEDLQIYHDGSGSYIDNTTGTLRIRDDSEVRICHTNNETYFAGSANGSSKLYYDDSVKLETKSYGADVTGYLQVGIGGGTNGLLANDSVKLRLGNDQDLEIYHDGTDSYIDNSTGELALRSDTIRLREKTGNETLAVFERNGAVKLYYDNGKRLETTSAGISINRQNAGEYFNVNANYGDTGDQAIECSGDLTFYTNASSIAARLDQDGLKFNADTAAANALDDYEEGTWTPNPLFGSTDAGETVDANGGLYGRYTKIGNLVYCHFSVNFSGRSGSASGNFKLDGLPFAISANNWNEDGGTVHYYTGTTSPNSHPTLVCENTNKVTFKQANSAMESANPGGWNDTWDTNEIGTGLIRIRGSFTYHTAA